MSVIDFEHHMEEPNMLPVDARNAYAFAGSHIPNSLSCGWEEQAFTQDG